MSLGEKIQNDLSRAIKQGDEFNRSVLRMLVASVAGREKEKRYKLIKTEKTEKAEGKELDKESRLNNEEIIELLQSEIKKRREAALVFKKGKRVDLSEKEEKEIKVLEKYLPEQLSDEKIREMVKEIIEKTGAASIRDMGKVMGEAMSEAKGRADGSRVSGIIKELLQSNQSN